MLGTTALPAAAQERARSLVLDFSQGLEAETNPQLEDDPERDEVVLRSDVDLRYVTATHAQRLELGVGGQFEAGQFTDVGSDARLAERRIDLGYTRESASGRLRVMADYARDRVEDTEVVEGFNSDDLEVTTGERGTGRLELELETGRERRVGTEVQGELSSVRYFGNDGEGRDSVDLQAALRLSVTARTDLLLLTGLSRDDYKADDQYETQTSSVGLGVRHELTARQRVHASLQTMRLARSEISEETGERESDNQDGLGAALGYDVDLGRGTLGVDFTSGLHSIGRRNLFEVSHETSSEAGALRLSLGVVDSELLDQQPLVNVEWTRNLPHGRLQISLDQAPTGTDDGDQESIASRLAASYLGRINSLSSWEVQVSLADSNEFGPDSEDGRRSEVMLGYRHALARDWDVAVRYRHVVSQNESRDDRRNDSLYLGLATRVTLW